MVLPLEPSDVPGVYRRGSKFVVVYRAGGRERKQLADTMADARAIKLQPLLGDDDARRRATVTLSAMVGAVMIARALGPTPGSDEILRDVREAVRERRLL